MNQVEVVAVELKRLNRHPFHLRHGKNCGTLETVGRKP